MENSLIEDIKIIIMIRKISKINNKIVIQIFLL